MAKPFGTEVILFIVLHHWKPHNSNMWLKFGKMADQWIGIVFLFNLRHSLLRLTNKWRNHLSLKTIKFEHMIEMMTVLLMTLPTCSLSWRDMIPISIYFCRGWYLRKAFFCFVDDSTCTLSGGEKMDQHTFVGDGTFNVFLFSEW